MNGAYLSVVLSPGGSAIAERSKDGRNKPQHCGVTSLWATAPRAGSNTSIDEGIRRIEQSYRDISES